MSRLKSKVVLISGLARGQGRAHAVRAAEEGADVIGFDICTDIASNGYALSSLADLDETRALIEKTGQRAHLVQADARDLPGLTAAVAAGVGELGGLDGVVAQAGICPLGNADPQAFLDVVNVNLGGVLNTVTAALPHLRERASIVAVGSLAGLMSGMTDNPANGAGGAGYSWSKRSVASFVHDFARVMAPHSIRVNGVHPTNVNTDMLQSDPMYRVFRPDLESPTREDAERSFPAMNLMPIGYVEPDDVSDAVLFLLSDASRFMTGNQLRVDAGAYLKRMPYNA